MWIEIDLEVTGDDVRAGARGSRGERAAARSLGPAVTLERLETFTSKIGRAVRGGSSIGDPLLAEAHALHEALFQGELRDLVTRLGEAAGSEPLLVRLMIRDRVLQSVPWEALCRPGTSEGFLGTDHTLLVARGVSSTGAWEPREVRGAVRVLAIAPGSDEGALAALQAALAPAVAAGEIEWLEPIAGAQAGQRHLFERLRRSKAPHVIHFLGHGGVDLAGKPTLRLADDEDGEETWIKAESLARELAAGFGEELRLVVLEACEGARPGIFGSAAELFTQAGADAAVAHLWPVRADTARACSADLYRTLTGGDRTQGDAGRSLAAARRALLLSSAEAFSPVLYLRGPGSVLFDFEGRRLARPSARRSGSGARKLAPALQSLLERPFSMILGDAGEDRSALRSALVRFHTENGDPDVTELPLAALTQRCALRFGEEVLHSLFHEALVETLEMPTPPLVDALGRLLRPGVHVTLLWLPLLERALARNQPGRTLYVIQPSLSGTSGRPRIVKRAAGAPGWRMEPGLPKQLDLDREIVVVRLYGGYSPEARPFLTSPMLTEDDHIHGLIGVEGFRSPVWAAEMMGRLRSSPALFLGISVLEWRHRMLLRWLFDHLPPPRDSLALLDPRVDAAEQEIWETGGGLRGAGRIPAIHEDPDELGALLSELPSPEDRDLSSS